MRLRVPRESTRRCSITTSKTRKRFIRRCWTKSLPEFEPQSTMRFRKHFRRAKGCKLMFVPILIASHPLYPRIVHAEFLRAGKDPSRLQRVAKQYFRPVFADIAALLKEGAESGDFRPVNPIHFIPSIIAVIVFYFTTAPIMKIMTGSDPMSPEQVAERRAAVVDFVSAAIFAPHRPNVHPSSNGRSARGGRT